MFRGPPDDPRDDRALDERRCGMRRLRALMIPEAGPPGTLMISRPDERRPDLQPLSRPCYCRKMQRIHRRLHCILQQLNVSNLLIALR